MTLLGTVGRGTFYIVRDTIPTPSDTSDFIPYSDYFVSAKIEGTLCDLHYLEAKIGRAHV